MKKLLLLMIVAFFVMLPLSAFAKAVISDSDLHDVTAQEGVTINFSCFTVGAITITAQSWGDSDGCTACTGVVYTSAGFVGAAISMATNFLTISGNMTIDVGTSGTRTALIIGLPTLNVGGTMTQVVKLGTAGTLAGNQSLGTSYISGLSVNPTGSLIIFAH